MTFLSRSVIFKGQIEKQVSGLTSLLDHPDIPVHVAINRDAIHVIDAKKNVSDVCCVAVLHFNVTGYSRRLNISGNYVLHLVAHKNCLLL